VSDTAARYGGEEFTVVLPETDIKGAVETAERLRKIVEKTEINIGEDKKISITASFGVASFDPSKTKEISSDFLINQADKMLYQAKQEGRNKVKALLI